MEITDAIEIDDSTYCDSDCDANNCDCTCHQISDDDYDTSFYDQQPNAFNVMMLTMAVDFVQELQESVTESDTEYESESDDPMVVDEEDPR
jgi:hypothetical protein